MNYDLIKIKEKYGEEMMRFCRSSFPDLLEIEGLLYKLISSNFDYNKCLYKDLDNFNLTNNFINYIYSLIKEKKEEINKKYSKKEKTPKELLLKAGYNLYECKTEEDIQSFKKYYARGEELCTFNGGRLRRCYVFFAVKKNVDQIRREDFKNPDRQDEYGTSVISIQFYRQHNNSLSIKNRYNHVVWNPDSTFSNNLDNIIPGLTESFAKTYNLNLSINNIKDFEIPGYVKANDGKYYKYNYEINNIYYCPNNIIIDGFNVIDDYKDKEKYIVIDYFIIDLVNKTVELFDNRKKDSFIETVQDIKKIDVKKDKETKNKIITFTFNNGGIATLLIDSNNRILSYSNSNVKIIDSCFLIYNEFLENIYLPNVKTIGHHFLNRNKKLKSIEFPNAEYIGDNFITYNEIIEKVHLPKVRFIGDSFLYSNTALKRLEIPSATRIGISFLNNNEDLNYINIDKVEYVDRNFMRGNKELKKFVAPNLKTISDNVLSTNKGLIYLSIPNVIEIGDSFLYENKELIKIEADNLKIVGNNFLNNNNSLEMLVLPNLESAENNFMIQNNSLIVAEFKKLRKTGSGFLFRNDTLKKLIMPNIYSLGHRSLNKNNSLEEINIYNLRSVDAEVLSSNRTLTNIEVPYLKKCDRTFLNRNLNFRSKRLVLSRKGKK